MANPESPNPLNYWVTNEIWFQVATPKSGTTGNLDSWVTDKIWEDVYTEVVGEAAASLVSPMTLNYIMPNLVR